MRDFLRTLRRERSVPISHRHILDGRHCQRLLLGNRVGYGAIHLLAGAFLDFVRKPFQKMKKNCSTTATVSAMTMPLRMVLVCVHNDDCDDASLRR